MFNTVKQFLPLLNTRRAMKTVASKPLLLSDAEQKAVSGGSPKGGWGPACVEIESPKGGW